jgi:hypothetical protein
LHTFDGEIEQKKGVCEDWSNSAVKRIHPFYACIVGFKDQAIFAGIISFYFGQRAMSKVRNGK